MARYSNTVTNNDTVPVPLSGALIYVYNSRDAALPLVALTDDAGAALANPVTSDAYGNFYFNAVDGVYRLDYWYQGKRRLIDEAVEVGVGLPLPDSVVLALASSSGAGLVGTTLGYSVQQFISNIISSAGASLIGFTQSGTGATARTAQDKLRERVTPEDFAGATQEAKILAAWNRSDVVELSNGATYSFTGRLTLTGAGEIHLNGATITGAVGFTGNSLISAPASIKIIGPGTIDGTNIPAPTGAYASGDYAGVGLYLGSAGDDGLIDGVTFQNFASGPILVNSALTPKGLNVKNCEFLNCQTYTTNETNGLVHFHGVSHGRQTDCRASGYNWKGFYVANGDYNQIKGCSAEGGVIGHASHYISGGSDNEILDGVKTGIGFGTKCFNSARPVVRNFLASGAQAAALFEGCTNFQGDSIRAENPNISAILVQGYSGVTTSGRLKNCYAKRASAGTTANHRGVYISAVSGGVIDDVTVEGGYFENMLYGVHIASSGFAQTNIEIIGNRFVNTGQYGVLANIGSGNISRNRFDMDGTSVEAGVYLARDGVTTTGMVEISMNEITRCDGDNIQIGEGARLAFQQIRITRNRVKGGARFLDYQGNANAADTVSLLVITGNSGTGLTTDACTLTFNGTTATVMQNEHNSFVNASFVDVVDTLSTTTNLRIKGSYPFSLTWDPGNLADGAGETLADTAVVGALLGVSIVQLVAPYDLQGITLNAYVKANGTVKARLQNETGGAIDLASGTWKGRIINP